MNFLKLATVTTLVLILLFFVTSLTTAEQNNNSSYEYQRGAIAVYPGITSPQTIQSLPHPISESKPRRKYHKDPYLPDPNELAKLITPLYDSKNPNHIIDPSITNNSNRASYEPCVSFSGIANTGWNPPDPDIAVGPDHVVCVVNSSIAVYDKQTGQQLVQSTANFWFQNTSPPPPSTFIFDPKIVYDPNPGRFIILYLCTDDVSQSSYLVSVSETSDAMGNWYSYNLDATLNGTIPTSTWPDYPGLGFDYDEAVYITTNQWQFGGGYLYTKVRMLDKNSLYSGGPVVWNDIWNLRYNNFSTAFTVKPASTLSDADGEFLLSNIWYGANYTTYWKITDPNGTPVATLKPQVNLTMSYSSPPDPKQLGGSPDLNILGPMTQEVFYRNGIVYTTFSQSFNWGSGTVSAIRMLGIDTVSSTATFDQVYGADNFYYYFPAIYVDPSDRVFAAFSRSSTSEYIGIHYVEDIMNDPASKLLKAGENHRSGSSPTRWGDYSGIAVDPVDQNNVWLYNEYAGSSSNSWRSWVGKIPSKIDQIQLNFPVNAEKITLPVELNWEEITLADSYNLQLDNIGDFSAPILDTIITDTSITFAILDDLTTHYWRVKAISGCAGNGWSDTHNFKVCDFLPGDVDGTGFVDISDAVFIIAYIFDDGVTPNPLEVADTDCSDNVDISDAVYLIAYIFGGGPLPCNAC